MSANPPTQYATDENLALRQRLWATSRREPALDLFAWVLALSGLDAGGSQHVLDIGCGNGSYEAALADRAHAGGRVALDLSAGMLAVVTGAARVQADAQALPFAPGAFDVVLAPHMLYHVPDVATLPSSTPTRSPTTSPASATTTRTRPGCRGRPWWHACATWPARRWSATGRCGSAP
jgi:SAM-dependent methyltransferase